MVTVILGSPLFAHGFVNKMYKILWRDFYGTSTYSELNLVGQ